MFPRRLVRPNVRHAKYYKGVNEDVRRINWWSVCVFIANITVCGNEHETQAHSSRQLNPKWTFGSKINEQKTKVKLLRNTLALRGQLTA